jgi:CubicO group peptidase (beta-lactamase class C family)
LRHTAGLVYGQFGDKLVHQAYREAKIGDRNDTLAEMVTKLAKIPLAHQPGEVWEYSVAVDVLGRVVEIVSGMELDRFVAERVTTPLHMAATDFYVHEPDLGRLAEAQADAAGTRPPLPDVTKKPRLFSGGSGMVSSAADYLRFCEMLLNSGEYGKVLLRLLPRRTSLLASVLAPHTVALMTSDALPPGVGYSDRARTVTGDIAPTPEMGQGFGLGFAVRTAPGRNPLPGSVETWHLGHDVLDRSSGETDRYSDDSGTSVGGRRLPPRLPQPGLSGDGNRLKSLTPDGVSPSRPAPALPRRFGRPHRRPRRTSTTATMVTTMTTPDGAIRRACICQACLRNPRRRSGALVNFRVNSWRADRPGEQCPLSAVSPRSWPPMWRGTRA